MLFAIPIGKTRFFILFFRKNIWQFWCVFLLHKFINSWLLVSPLDLDTILNYLDGLIQNLI